MNPSDKNGDVLRNAKDRIDDYIAEGVQDATSDLTAQEIDAQESEATIEQLREMAGADAADMTDEQLTAAWKKIQTGDDAKVEGDGTTKDAAPEWKRHYGLLDHEGKALADLKMAIAAGDVPDKLRFKLAIDGQEKVYGLDDLVRQAERSVLEARRNASLTQQRNQAAEEADKLRDEVKSANDDRSLWARALADPTGEVFKQIQAAWQQAPTGSRVDAPAAVVDKGNGEQEYQQTIVPQLERLAGSYTKDGNPLPATESLRLFRAVDMAFRAACAREGRFLTNDRIREIITYDIPQGLADAGYHPMNAAVAPKPSAGAVDPRDAEIAALKAQIGEAAKVAQKNKVKSGPGAGGSGDGGSGTAGGAGVNTARTARDFRKILQDPSQHFGN